MSAIRRTATLLTALALVMQAAPARVLATPTASVSAEAVRVGQSVEFNGSIPVGESDRPLLVEVERLVSGAWLPEDSIVPSTSLACVRRAVGALDELVSAPLSASTQQGARVVTVQARNALSGVVLPEAHLPATVTVGDAAICIAEARADGSSPLFSLPQRIAPPLTENGSASAVLSSFALTTKSGREATIFSASNSPESVSEGSTYVRSAGEEDLSLLSIPDRKVMTFASPLATPEGVLLASVVRDASMDSAVRIDLVDPELRQILRTVTVAGKAGYNYQTYSLTRHSSGLLLLPVCTAPTASITTGPWMLQLFTSADEGATWSVAGSTWMTGSRGIMEPSACEVADGRVVILFRSELGRVGRVDWAPGQSLGAPKLTRLTAPSAAIDARTLPDGRVAVAWMASVPNSPASSLPRHVLAVGVSDDGVETVSSLHVVATSAAFGDSLRATFPYISQPNVSVTNGELRVAFERVVNAATIESYVTTAALPLPANVATSGSRLSVSPARPGTERHVLSASEPATFDLTGEALEPSEWSARLRFTSPGVRRLRIVAQGEPNECSEWRYVYVGATRLSEYALSKTTVAYGSPAIISARLLEGGSTPLAGRAVQLLRNGLPVASSVTGIDGSVRFPVSSRVPCKWSLAFAGDATSMPARTRPYYTRPVFAFTCEAGSTGAVSGRAFLRRGRSYRFLGEGTVTLSTRGWKRSLSSSSVFTVPATRDYAVSGRVRPGTVALIW